MSQMLRVSLEYLDGTKLLTFKTYVQPSPGHNHGSDLQDLDLSWNE